MRMFHFEPFSETFPANKETRHICDEVKEKTKTTYEVFQAAEYRVQQQEPLYLIKVKTDDNDYLHLIVYVLFIGLLTTR
ncbi:cystatin-A [Nothobranchius furzeri]|uniref:cystatin-A n=1 Tax=Nothobranchius furzeri TaxID=105023 RepID=UPI003904D91E